MDVKLEKEINTLITNRILAYHSQLIETKQIQIVKLMGPEMIKKNRILVFPKGTIVKFDGIPCELLEDTMYESVHFRNNKPNEG